MPSALEKLVKILKLEQDLGYQDRAVIGGLRSFAEHWARDAHSQARKPEHHALIDELLAVMMQYAEAERPGPRQELIRYMLARITGRAAPRGETPGPASPPDTANTAIVAPPSPPEPVRVQPKPMPAPPSVPEARPPAPPRGSNPPAKTPFGAPKRLGERKATGAGGSFAQGDGQPEDRSTGEEADPYAPAPISPAPVSAPPERPSRPPRRSRSTRDPQREAENRAALAQPVTELKGIGPKIGARLSTLGLNTIEDWLHFYPRKYIDYTQLLPLRRVQPGMQVTVIGTVRSAVILKGRGVDVLAVTIDDGSGMLTASFFGQPYLIEKFTRGTPVVFSGKTGLYQRRITMDNPEWEPVEQDALHTRKIIPVYPLTKGLSAHAMRRLSANVIEKWADRLPDPIPPAVLERLDLAELPWAIRQMHFPESFEALDMARRRLSFDSLLLLQLAKLRSRRAWQAVPGIPLEIGDSDLDALIAGLPYPLTGAQTRAVKTIRADLARPVPMNRLLQGDVGSGKTAVAALSLLVAVAGGAQGVLMAPTSILAEQHFKGVTRLIDDMAGEGRVQIVLLTGATPAAERRAILEKLRSGDVQIAIGTHALIQEGVEFSRLALAVIDEQHRFGVEQRGRLRGKGTNPHVLVMSATPIPRTLALTRYADLDLSVLDEMPPGRTPIQTRVIPPKERETIYDLIYSQVHKQRQAFVVYPLIDTEDGESENVRAAVREYERLQNEVFPNLRLGLLHGKMNPTQKESVMSAFSRGELDVLIATSVVEVGIDVPNASVILIENAERFGLAQLHQLRGRVGRGMHPGMCILVAENGQDNARLMAMQETTDGFELARLDWEQRGAGDLLGTRQSGGGLALEDFMDSPLVELAQLEARTLYAEDPDLGLPQHDLLRTVIVARFGASDQADVS